jgi:hypothetical protein
MPTKGFQNGKKKAYNTPPADNGVASLPPPPQQEVPINENSPEPPPANGTHYSLYEMLSILKGKRSISSTINRWKDQGLSLCGLSTIYRVHKIAKETGIMPDKDDYGCLAGRPSTYKTPLTCEEVVAALAVRSAAGKTTKSTTSGRRFPPKEVDVTTLPPPANGTHYCQYEAVTILAGTTEKFARTSILKQWLEQNLVRFSRSKVYRLLREHKKSGEIPPKGYYGGNSGRPPLQQEGGLTIEELVDYNTKRKHHRASMSQDKSKKKQKSASHHQEEDTDSENDSEDEVCTSP